MQKIGFLMMQLILCYYYNSLYNVFCIRSLLYLYIKYFNLKPVFVVFYIEKCGPSFVGFDHHLGCRVVSLSKTLHPTNTDTHEKVAPS